MPEMAITDLDVDFRKQQVSKIPGFGARPEIRTEPKKHI